MDWGWLDWVAVVLLGAVVGAGELASRYKDDPVAAIRTWPAIFYIAINGGASVAALGLIRATPLSVQARWTQILLAGISAMAFFRTSLFVVRAGDRDVGVGPSGFLQIFLSVADRAVDRQRATVRSDAVANAMKEVDFSKAVKALPPFCLGLMQNITPEDQQKLKQAVEDLETSDEEASVKSLLLGLELMNVVGKDVLTTAVGSLGEQIRSLPKA